MKQYAFVDVVTDATSKFRKIKASDYQSHGRYKIVDQGKEPIAGYTDDPNLVNTQPLPVIIFGDHTRVLKYEEQPIALGADGTKALWVNPVIANARYVYYYLRSIHIKEAGYSRHFKFLKEVEIPIPLINGIPDLEWQARVADLLGKVEGLIINRARHIEYLDDLARSLFLEMFGDPVRNEKGWDRTTIGQIIKVASGNALVAKKMNADGVHKVYGGNGVNGVHSEYMFDDPTLVIGRVGYYCGSVHITEPRSWVTDNALYVKEFLKETDLVFLKYLLSVHNLNKVAGRAAQPLVSGSRIYPVDTIDVPYEYQKRFSALVNKIEEIKLCYQQSFTDLRALYGSISQQAFKGQLDVSRVPLPVLTNAHVTIRDGDEVSEHSVQEEPLIKLPDTGGLSEALESSHARRALIAEWLETYRMQLGEAPFLLHDFVLVAVGRLTKSLQAVMEDEAVADERKNRLAEYYPNNEVRLGATEYDCIKTWVFDALAAGTLKQEGGKDTARIELRAVHS